MLTICFQMLFLLLALLGAAQVIALLAQIFWRKGTARAVTLTVIPADGSQTDLEYQIRAARADLQRLSTFHRRLIVLNLAMTQEEKELVEKTKGVTLLTQDELIRLLPEILLEQKNTFYP